MVTTVRHGSRGMAWYGWQPWYGTRSEQSKTGAEERVGAGFCKMLAGFFKNYSIEPRNHGKVLAYLVVVSLAGWVVQVRCGAV